jgi:hypothetical protein
MTFVTATSMPLLIALAEIGQRDGVMLPATTAALVGAGVLSVLLYPLVAVGLHRSARTRKKAAVTVAKSQAAKRPWRAGRIPFRARGRCRVAAGRR